MQSSNRPRGRGPKILVVDDDPEIVHMLETVLNEQGYQTSAAYDGPSALDVLRQERPDFIVLDTLLPRMGGWEVCLQIRGQPGFEHTPILMTSATLRPSPEECLEADFLAKPFDIDELLDRIETALRASSHSRLR